MSFASKWMKKTAIVSRISGISVSKQPELKMEPLPEWQHNFCIAHAEFNNWCGGCPYSIDDCLISKIMDSDGNIDKLRKLKIGQDITTDMVIDEWLKNGGPVADLFKNPAWFICIAETMSTVENSRRPDNGC
jgi:hypothetical protein